MQIEQLKELQQRIKTSSLSVAKALNHLSDQQQQQGKKHAANKQEVGCQSIVSGYNTSTSLQTILSLFAESITMLEIYKCVLSDLTSKCFHVFSIIFTRAKRDLSDA